MVCVIFTCAYNTFIEIEKKYRELVYINYSSRYRSNVFFFFLLRYEKKELDAAQAPPV